MIGCDNDNKKIDLHQYVQLLRQRGILKSKQTMFLDALTLYISDGFVYKILLIAYKPNKKAGLEHTHKMIKEGLPKNPIAAFDEVDFSQGNFCV